MVSPDLNAGPGMLGYVVLMDPVTKQPYTAQNIVQQTDKEFSTAGLATTEKQDEQLAILQSLAENSVAARPVEIQNPEMPLPNGAATSEKQDQIISGLSSVASALGGTLTVTPSGTLAVSVASLPLPAGSATFAGQAEIVSSLNELLDLLTDGIEVVGAVTVPDGVDVRGAVTIANTSLAVTPSGTFAVTMAGSATEAKQDAILTALGNLQSVLQSPQPITDNGGSLTVDGAVAVSGAVQVEDNGKSLTVDGTVGATQSGPWTVGINGTVPVSIASPVVVQDADGGPMAVNGTVAATQSGSWSVGITGTPTVNVGNTVTISDGSGPLTVDGTVALSNASLPVTQSGTWSVGLTNASLPVTQSGTWNFTMTPTATAAALTPFRNTALTATPVQVKSGAGRVYQYSFYNPTNAAVYVHFYNALPANITAGTTVPLVTLGVPAGSSLDGAWSASPAAFGTAISIAASTAVAGTGNPSTGILAQIGYV